MEIKDKIIALLIDSDNISRDYYNILLDELSKYGRVTYRKLYGDFSKPKSNGWKDILLEYSIEQVQQIAFTSGKNASDSSMIIDAMDILYKGKVDCFCLATSDSDFTSLAMRFRNDNIIVIGAGEEKTPNSFRKACDRFIPIDELLKAKDEEKIEEQKRICDEKKELSDNSMKSIKSKKYQAKTKTVSTRNEKLTNLITMAIQIVNDGAESDGLMHFSAFMNEVYRKENDFNTKLYGYVTNSPLAFFKSLKGVDDNPIFVLEKRDKVDRIKLSTAAKKETI